MIYDVMFYEGKWWLTKNGKIIRSIGGFCEPISPEIIKKVIENEINME